MKLALFTHMSWPEGVNQTSVFHNSVEQVKLAESMGYHGAWFACLLYTSDAADE